MFRAVSRSSSGALTVFAASGLDAANTVRAPDDKRRTARNMLSLYPFKARIKFHLLFADIISSPFSPR